MPTDRSELLHGTLELLVLTLLRDGPLNGYAVGRRIAELTNDALAVEEGTLYPALYRMERRGWLRSAWGTSDNNRRAKFYRLTAAGRRRLGQEQGRWADFTTAVQRILDS